MNKKVLHAAETQFSQIVCFEDQATKIFDEWVCAFKTSDFVKI